MFFYLEDGESNGQEDGSRDYVMLRPEESS